MNKKNLRKGFTTVELVIVIAVIAILATALIPTFGGLINSANKTVAMNEARETFNNALAHDLNIFTGKTAAILVEGEAGTADDLYYLVESGNQLNTKNPVSDAPAGTAEAPLLIIKASETGTYFVCVNPVCAGADSTNKCDTCGNTISANNG